MLCNLVEVSAFLLTYNTTVSTFSDAVVSSCSIRSVFSACAWLGYPILVGLAFVARPCFWLFGCRLVMPYQTISLVCSASSDGFQSCLKVIYPKIEFRNVICDWKRQASFNISSNYEKSLLYCKCIRKLFPDLTAWNMLFNKSNNRAVKNR